MAKEPTKPPEGIKKPTPPRSPFSGRRLDGLPESVPTAAFVGHTSDPDFNPPDRKSGPDNEVVFSEAVTCTEHEDCMTVTTQLGSDTSRTNDPGYEPPSRTADENPNGIGVTPTYVPPPFEPVSFDGAGGLYWDIPDAVLAGSDEPLDRPYAIIEDMGTLFRELIDDVLDATAKLRSAALRYACRLIAGVFGVVIFGLLIVGGVGVVLAVWLFKAMDKAELIYWENREERQHRHSRKTAQRMNHIRKKP